MSLPGRNQSNFTCGGQIPTHHAFFSTNEDGKEQMRQGDLPFHAPCPCQLGPDPSPERCCCFDHSLQEQIFMLHLWLISSSVLLPGKIFSSGRLSILYQNNSKRAALWTKHYLFIQPKHLEQKDKTRRTINIFSFTKRLLFQALLPSFHYGYSHLWLGETHGMSCETMQPRQHSQIFSGQCWETTQPLFSFFITRAGLGTV